MTSTSYDIETERTLADKIKKTVVELNILTDKATQLGMYVHFEVQSGTASKFSGGRCHEEVSARLQLNL